MNLDDYISAHISAEPEHLHQLYRNTFLKHLYPRMCTDHAQGRFLKMLTSMIAPQRILELGTFTGYATLCIAEGMPQGAQISTIEIDDEMEPELRQTFAGTVWVDDIHLYIGDALDVIEELEPGWDMAVIDADKRLYPDYLELLLPRMNEGGYIIADNTLWSGKPADPANTDPQTEGIRRFNEMVASNPNLETVIVPFSDGLTISRLIKQ